MHLSPTHIFTLLVLSVDIVFGLPCPPGKKTDDPQGRCCVFPFEYGGVTYQSCTKVAHHRLWCSFDEVYKGQWANCVNPCTNSPCQNGGVCTVTGDDSYSCKCADGYYGQTCEKVSPCKSHPCKNGGTCTMTSLDSFSCKCTDDFEGDTCEKLSLCKSHPCKNGGTCTMTCLDSFSCQCTDDFEGDTCEKRLPCPPGKKTEDPQGRCCVFPFEYEGKTYQSCTKVAHHRLWCSFDKVYKGQWANCVAWKSEGCFKEHKRKAEMVLGRNIATVPGKKLSIQDIFDKCKIAAEKKGFKIFGIRNRNRCFSTSDGKVQEFKKYGVSSKCKIDDNGLGVGMQLANFVYTRL